MTSIQRYLQSAFDNVRILHCNQFSAQHTSDRGAHTPYAAFDDDNCSNDHRANNNASHNHKENYTTHNNTHDNAHDNAHNNDNDDNYNNDYNHNDDYDAAQHASHLHNARTAACVNTNSGART